MPAPDFDTCYDFESQIELATKQMISSSVMDFGNSRETSVSNTPSVSIRFLLGAPTGHLQLLTSGSVLRAKYDTYDGNLECNITTDRAIDNSYSSTYLRKVRNIISDYHNYKAYLSYHDVLDVQSIDTVSTVDDEINQDKSTMRFNLRVCVIPTAWPTSSI